MEAHKAECSIEPDPRRVVFNRARLGETREGCKASGMHSFYMLGPDDVWRLMREVDGATRGIPKRLTN